jgi:hypothetical protein
MEFTEFTLSKHAEDAIQERGIRFEWVAMKIEYAPEVDALDLNARPITVEHPSSARPQHPLVEPAQALSIHECGGWRRDWSRIPD